MNKTELLNKADELIRKANQLKELANKKDDIILVPDEIKITKSVYWYSKWIQNWNKELLYNYHDQDWVVVLSFSTDYLIKCKLTPCSYQDLKPWDLFYRGDEDEEDFKDLLWYAIKLNDWTYQYWDGKDCVNRNFVWEYHWKVEAI